jgi:hypothetical protein
MNSLASGKRSEKIIIIGGQETNGLDYIYNIYVFVKRNDSHIILVKVVILFG